MGWSPRSPALQLLLLLAVTATASAGRFEHGHTSAAAAQPSSLLGPLPALTRRLLGIRAAADQQLHHPAQHATGRKLLVTGGSSTCSVDASSLNAANSAVRAEATMSVDYGTNVTGYFRMRFVDCSPANSTICTNSTFGGQPGVFEVGSWIPRRTRHAASRTKVAAAAAAAAASGTLALGSTAVSASDWNCDTHSVALWRLLSTAACIRRISRRSLAIRPVCMRSAPPAQHRQQHSLDCIPWTAAVIIAALVMLRCMRCIPLRQWAMYAAVYARRMATALMVHAQLILAVSSWFNSSRAANAWAAELCQQQYSRFSTDEQTCSTKHLGQLQPAAYQ